MNEINKIWPKWHVEEVLGQGGFGTVYKAKREDFGAVTYSAIKVVKIPNNTSEVKEMTSSGMSSEQIRDYYHKNVASLIDEIKLMETLKSSPNIVSIEDFETRENEDGFGWTIFIRMELLTNITQYFSNKELNIKEVVKLGIDICSALEHCHQLNIIHRDIKPDNIFISKFGDYKLGDFGVSRQTEQSIATMSQKGTKSYMAPEMIRMEKYGKNVDLYALALTMYELLNHGRMPFLPVFPNPFYPQDREAAMYRRLSGEVFPEIEGIGNLNEIIQKACHKDSSMRYQSATEMKNALQEYLRNNKNDVNEVIIEETYDDEKTVLGMESIFNDEQTVVGANSYFVEEKTVGIFEHGIPFKEKTVEKKEEVKVEIKEEVQQEIIEEKVVSKKKSNKLLFIIPVLVILLGAVIGGSILFGGDNSSSGYDNNDVSDRYDYLKHLSTDVYYEIMDGIIDITVVPTSQMYYSDKPEHDGLFVLEVRSTFNESGVDAKIEQYDVLTGFDQTDFYSVDQMDALFAIGGIFELEVGKYKYDYKRTYICDVSVLENPLFDSNTLGITVMNVNEFAEYSANYDEDLPVSKNDIDDYLLMFEENYIEDGIVIVDVAKNSLAEKYGFMVGDVISEFNGNTVHDLSDFPEGCFEQIGPNQTDSFYVKRQSQDISIDVVRP